MDAAWMAFFGGLIFGFLFGHAMGIEKGREEVRKRWGEADRLRMWKDGNSAPRPR